MDEITADTVDDILGEAYALLCQAQRICEKEGQEYLPHINPVVEYLTCIPSAHGDGRKIIFQPIPE
jgi:hypothetical protein